MSRTEEEWQLRRELAACFRLLAHFRMTDLIYTHVTVRLPAPGQSGRLRHPRRNSRRA